MTDTSHGEIFSEDYLKPFLPQAAFTKNAQVNDDRLYREAAANRLVYWAKMAESLEWSRKWDQVLDESNPPYYKWFTNGKLNVSVNCLDRHVNGINSNKKALIFHGENDDVTELTYSELLVEVCKFSNVLRKLGIKKGDSVTIWMPMIPEAIVAMLACTRVGAVHSVVFGGFSPDALKDRILDSQL